MSMRLNNQIITLINIPQSELVHLIVSVAQTSMIHKGKCSCKQYKQAADVMLK